MESERLSSLLETSAHVRSLRSSLLAANVWQQMVSCVKLGRVCKL